MPDTGSQAHEGAPQLVGNLGPIGGQAILEGVMMRRGRAWGAAVRTQDGSIVTTTQTIAQPAAVTRLPLVRGIYSLFDSVRLGTRSMVWGAQARGTEDGRGFSRIGIVTSTVIAAVVAISVLGVLPAAIPKLLGLHGRWSPSLAEGAIRVTVLVGYMWLLSLNKEVRRTFAYHGAEHMTIHAFEHGVELKPDQIRRFDRRHPRCGTAFLLIVILVALIVNVMIGDLGWKGLVIARIVQLPVIAALAYELIRFAGLRRHSLIGKVLMAPGSWLQTVTTKEPDDAQIEVAVAALQATLAAETSSTPAFQPLAAIPIDA